MRNRKVVLSGLTLAGIAMAGACSDDLTPPAPLGAELDTPLFSSNAARSTPHTLDDQFAQMARETPGFGGLYYDEAGALTVVMAGEAMPLSAGALEGALRSGLSRLGVAAADVRTAKVQQGQYDFLQLRAVQQNARHVLGLAGVVFSDVDEVRNRVVIGVESSAAARSVEHALQMLDLAPEAVIIELTEPIEVETNHTLRDRVRPVAGGLQINFTRGASGFLCTLGFNVRSPVAPNVHGFVTNSHCSDTRGVVVPTPYWQHSRFAEETFIGWEEHDLPFFQDGPCPEGRNCRYSDALGARYEAGVDNAFGQIYRTIELGSLEIDPVTPRWQIVAELPFPIVGQVLHKTGRTSGWTMGEVTATCVTSNVAGEGSITMLCQDRVATTSAGGDSGAPYFVRIGETNNVALIGIHWGSGGGTTVMSAMNNIRCENQGPAPWITYPGQVPPAVPPCTRP